MNRSIRVHIESMAFKGYGVTRAQGKVIFIPYGVTGDHAWVEIVHEKKDYSIGRLIKLVDPSPWRTDPLCQVFQVCGGCQWQYIDPSIQGELKKEVLKESLKRLGGLKHMPSITLAPSPHPYGYRTRVQLKAKGETIGYYEKKSHRLVSIEHCPLSHPLVNQIIPLLRNEISPFARMEEIEINVSPEEGRGVLVLHPLSFHHGLQHFMKDFLRNHPVLKGLAFISKKGRTLLGDPYLHLTLSLNQWGRERNLRLRISPESFYQVNLEQNQTLIQTVLNFSDVTEEVKVLDLYAGVGNFTLPLAIRAKEVWGIEENERAVGDALFNAERNGIKNCTFILGRVEEVLRHLEWENPDLVILDPPRMGCKMALNQVVKLEPKKIVYVSCEPTTFSRDLRLFSERGYHLQKLTVIDMFPQTYHMEVVGLLTL